MTIQTNDANEDLSAAPSVAAAPSVILIEPQLGENIGTAARAMANFGLDDLRLVRPRDSWPNEKAVAAASGADWVLEKTRLFESTAAAVADLNYVCATTARSRDVIKPVFTPATATAEMALRIGSGQTCGIMFGREKSGLDNDQLALCDNIVTAPVNPNFASINLAQSVLLMGYEWARRNPELGLGRETEFDGPAREGLQMHRTRPATRAEIIGFFEHLEEELDKSGFLWPPEKRPVMVRNLRNLFNRMSPSEQEVRTLRGIVSSLSKRGNKRDDAP